MECPVPYALDQLGWLQFERLIDFLVLPDSGSARPVWSGRADEGRVAAFEDVLEIPALKVAMPGPVTVVVVWVADVGSDQRCYARLGEMVTALWRDSEVPFESRVVVFTNLELRPELPGRPEYAWRSETDVVRFVGARELSDCLDARPGLRAAMPSVLGLRDLSRLIETDVAARSSLDIDRVQALARVFWATGAYDRAREVLSQYGFVVLTGPPEMGKTAIAEMIGLAQMTNGWQVHECLTPKQLAGMFDASAPQVFIADDAFGSTGGQPTAPVAIAQTGQLDDSPELQLAVDPRGDALLTWQQLTRRAGDVNLVAARRTATSNFTPGKIIGPSYGGGNWNTAIGARGAAIISWDILGAPATTRIAPGPQAQWAPAHRLTPASDNSLEPVATIDGKGRATALWDDGGPLNPTATDPARPIALRYSRYRP